MPTTFNPNFALLASAFSLSLAAPAFANPPGLAAEIAPGGVAPAVAMRAESLFVRNWRFELTDDDSAAELDFDDSSWRVLDVPHDWSIEGAYAEDNPSGAMGAFLPGGVGWYRKQLNWQPEWGGKRVSLSFDGIAMNASVFLNGEELAFKPYGYIGFSVDLTGKLNRGNNVIAVRVDQSKLPSSRWYTGSGIIRDVSLRVTGQVHVIEHGSFVTSPSVADDKALIRMEHELHNASAREVDDEARVSIFDPAGKLVAQGSVPAAIEPGATAKVVHELTVATPLKWSPDSPSLYRAEFEFGPKEAPQDRYETRFGIRSLAFSVQRGFELNGEPIVLRGVSVHDDGGPVGAAVPLDIWRFRFDQLKKMGANAVRTAHNPFERGFYQLADEMGLMVMDEAFDGWETEKAPYDYGLYYEEWWERDLSEFVRRTRNSPSVIMWSVGNEVVDATPETQKKLVDLIRSIDSTRPITQGRGGALPHADIVGFNGEGEFKDAVADYHETYPDRVLIGTEMTHTQHTRGIYRSRTEYRTRDNPWPHEIAQPGGSRGAWDRMKDKVYPVVDLTEEEAWPEHSLRYASDFDNNLVRMPIRTEIQLANELSYFIGTFRWSGFDYLGESLGWPGRTMNFGVIDLAGFEKGPYDLYRSQWNSEPMVSLQPHWTWPGKENVVLPVVVYTNFEKAELFLNGQSLGSKSIGQDMQLVWQVPYQPGELKVVAASPDGTIRSATHQTAGSPAKISARTDKSFIPADGRGMTRVEVQIADAADVAAPTASNRLNFSLSGPGRIIAVENGDILDTEPTKGTSRKAFNGKAVAFVQSLYEPGLITVSINSEGLKPAEVAIVAGEGSQ
ncbi:glycoside hydrolase family 2 TIM barrel-domain containing protein [Altererythrobacter sp. GH1-8]|uniref:glycoside hydrolase family 2 TIM barrel-domain containing protein n=1 Tax=Altererythrobacter sp. GH1-8 TaxID=3349333 RepID=UPI00374DB4F5